MQAYLCLQAFKLDGEYVSLGACSPHCCCVQLRCILLHSLLVDGNARVQLNHLLARPASGNQLMLVKSNVREIQVSIAAAVNADQGSYSQAVQQAAEEQLELRVAQGTCSAAATMLHNSI
jgi:hypothetical protein